MNRPDDDELAFVYYEKMFRARLDSALKELAAPHSDEYWNSYNHFMQTYINQILSVVRALELPMLEHWVNNPRDANNERYCKQIKFDIDGAVTEIKVRRAQVARKTSVKLQSEEREKIRDLINKIKLTIDAIEIPAPRKESLMSKLNAFAAEVDRDRTRYDVFATLVIDAAGVVGKAERKLRPVRKWIDSIAGLLHEARSLEDSRLVLRPPDRRVEGPRKQLAPPSSQLWASPEVASDVDERDDEIPF